MNHYFVYHLSNLKNIRIYYVYDKKYKKINEFGEGKLLYKSKLSLNSFESIFSIKNGWKSIPIHKDKIKTIKLLSRFQVQENEVLKRLELYEWQI